MAASVGKGVRAVNEWNVTILTSGGAAAGGDVMMFCDLARAV
jgi:hypothetical protein